MQFLYDAPDPGARANPKDAGDVPTSGKVIGQMNRHGAPILSYQDIAIVL